MNETQEAQPAGTAVQLAELTGMVRQVISDHERRLAALELRTGTSATRTAALWGPILAGAALLLSIAGKLPWQ